MKYAIVLLLFAASTLASATNYYVSSAGNDLSDGLTESTPWKTIAKVNSVFAGLKAGDRVLFRCGDVFYGTVNINRSGISGFPITIGSYGTGGKPVITGFTTPVSWTNTGGGIYSTPLSCESAPEMLIIDGVQYGMGRYPNNDYLKYESFYTNVSITDNELGSSPYWKGAEAVIRKTNWILDRCLITEHAGTKITYQNLGTSYSGTNNYGYFFQNDIKTLDLFGEWYFNGTTLFVFFGTKSPELLQVRVSTINNLILNNSGQDNIRVENISFSGANKSSVYLSAADYFTVQNCDIDFSGENGIFIQWGSYVTCDNNLINNSNRAGIYCAGGKNATFTNNMIRNSGIIPGAATTATQNNGIYLTQNDNGLIQYNDINYSGGNGIYFTGNNVVVKNNFVNNSCQILHDCGGIYTIGIFSGRVIEGNIVLNSLGNTEGTANPAYVYAEGIFTDAQAQNIVIKDNTAAFCRRSGIFFHESHDHTCTGNTCFNNLQQVRFQFGERFPNDYIRNITFRNNILVAKEPVQYALWARSSREDIPGYVIADYNYYARPVDDNNVFYTQTPLTGVNYRNLESWQSYTKQDPNSGKSPVTLTESDQIRFEYNASKNNRVVYLNEPMIDIKGNKYSTSITLLPYTSIILLPDPDPAVRPEPVSSAIENATPGILNINFSLNLSNIVPPASSFTVKVNSTPRTVSSVSISGPTVSLVLASPVINGDNVTVSYNIPATNALRCTAGWYVLSFSDLPVTNKVDAIRPALINSVIENASPDILDMNFSLSLSSITPPASAFTVMVNSVQRTVSSVTVSDTGVQLKLGTPVTYGDNITVAYTVPSTNALRSSTGWYVLTFSAKTVTNKIEALRPELVSAAIENSTPYIIDLTFSLNLSGIIPPATAFTVTVNSVQRTVSSVMVSGTNVRLSLSASVNYGDNVTVAYTIPASNALRSGTGWWVLSFGPQPVNNKVEAARPVFISAIIENYSPDIIDITFSLNLSGITPPASAFTVMVNSVTTSVTRVVISGTKVQLYLASPVTSGDIVTVAYTIPATNALRSSTGWWVLSFGPQPVVNNVDAVRPVFVNAVVENSVPDVIVINFSLNLATIVPPASAFTVLVNSQARTVSTVNVSGTKVSLKLSLPVLYGDNITVAYTVPQTNALRSSTGWWVLTFSSRPVLNNVVQLSFNTPSAKGETEDFMKNFNTGTDQEAENQEINIDNRKFMIYPNPAKEYINLILPGSSAEIQYIRIYDLSGKLCQEHQVGPGVDQLEIPLDLKRGLYYTRLSRNGIILATCKLIVAE